MNLLDLYQYGEVAGSELGGDLGDGLRSQFSCLIVPREGLYSDGMLLIWTGVLVLIIGFKVSPVIEGFLPINSG